MSHPIVFVRPAEGRRVRAPDGQVIPEAGMHLERDLYLRRRLRAGDLVVIEEEAAGAEPTPAEPVPEPEPVPEADVASAEPAPAEPPAATAATAEPVPEAKATPQKRTRA